MQETAHPLILSLLVIAIQQKVGGHGQNMSGLYRLHMGLLRCDFKRTSSTLTDYCKNYKMTPPTKKRKL